MSLPELHAIAPLAPPAMTLPPHFRRARRPAPWRVLALATALGLAACLLLAAGAWAQSPAPPTRVPKDIQPLLSADLDTWMQGLDALRHNPNARQLLLLALAVQPAPERRWRIIHALAEFGTADDVGALVPLLDGMPAGLERRTIIGTLRALYPTPPPDTDLSATVKDFAYLQTAPPSPYQPDQAGKYAVTGFALDSYWVDRVSPQVMERLLPLKGRSFATQKAIAEALQSRLTPRLWQDNGDRLLAPLAPTPARMVQDGVLRYTLANALTRPLLLTVDAAVWFGYASDPLEQHYVYLKPGESQQVDAPIRVIGPKDPGRVRIDLRAREVNGQRVPFNNKLYVPMQG